MVYNYNQNNNITKGGGVGFVGLLQLAFIILKLCNVISWSWFWVLFPLILSGGLIAISLIVLVALAIIAKFC